MIHLATLQSGIVDHCNNHCASCSQFSPVSRPRVMRPEVLEADLTELAKISTTDVFHIVGGEPFLHPFLPEILRAVHQSGITQIVSIYTNGKLLRKMPTGFWEDRLLQQLHISQYPNTSEDTLDYARKLSSQYGFELEAWPQFSFYTVQPHAIQDLAETYESFNSCPWRYGCNAVRYGYFYLCSHSARIADVLLNEPEWTQGLKIEGLTEVALQTFLTRTEPLQACQYCHNHHEQRPWKEIKDRDDWLKDSKA
jgi:cyclic pyranopterin phosphate synthase